MKVLKNDYNHYEIFLNHYDIDHFDILQKQELEDYLKSIFLRLKKGYRMTINGYYEIDAYYDNSYGMILNMEKEDIDYYEFSFNQIDMRITLDRNCRFLYLFEDCFEIPEKLKKKGICYFYHNQCYFLPQLELTELEIGALLEKSVLVYQDTDMIISSGKVFQTT